MKAGFDMLLYIVLTIIAVVALHWAIHQIGWV